MPIDYKKYPKNWKQLRAAVLDRANDKCELCFCDNGKIFYRDKQGFPWGPRNQPLFDPLKKVKIILTIHHINHDISDNRLVNLIALCQRCHLRLDLPWKIRILPAPAVSKGGRR